MGLSFLIGLVIFAIAIIAAGGIYFYKADRYETLVEKQELLKETNDQLEASDVIQSIEDLRTLRDQIDQVSLILDRHVAISSLFNFLETTTLSSISFGSFSLEAVKDGAVSVTMVGQADSYTSLANQSKIYTTKDDVLLEYRLGGFKLTERGTIEFTFKGTIDMEKLYYVNTRVDSLGSEGLDEVVDE